jgi:hypothetical protein
MVKLEHQRAMDLCDVALVHRRLGEEASSKELFLEAFQCERRASDILAAIGGFEPSRSIIHRSAASLAMECGLRSEAENLVVRGLKGNPPQVIAEGLKRILGN